MSDLLRAYTVTCPVCWEPNELLVDLSAGDQAYTEDCTVCCRPMAVTVSVRGQDAELEVESEA